MRRDEKSAYYASSKRSGETTVVTTRKPSLRTTGNEVHYDDEHTYLDGCRNRRLPGALRTRLLLPLPPQRPELQVNPCGRRGISLRASRTPTHQGRTGEVLYRGRILRRTVRRRRVPNLLLPSLLRRLPNHLAFARIRPGDRHGKRPFVALDTFAHSEDRTREADRIAQPRKELGLRHRPARIPGMGISGERQHLSVRQTSNVSAPATAPRR